jgi:putative ABC transport system permease protein
MLRDFRFALRRLAARPGFTFMAALSLALGIGANSAIFSVIDGMWFRPPGVAHPSRLVRIFSVSPEERQGMLSYPEFRDLRSQTTAFSDVVAVGGRGLTLIDGDDHKLVNLNLVSTNFFGALGVHPALGKLFTSEEDGHAGDVSVILGNAFWKRQYGGDPSIVGRQIHVRRAHSLLVTVIGVLPPDFRSLESDGDRDLWFAEPAWSQLGDPAELQARAGRWFHVVGVLAPRASLRQANAQILTAAQRMATTYPQTNTRRSAVAVSDLRYRLDEAGSNGLALLGIVLLVIVISSVNVANLLLSHATARRTEMAVRLSMGADRYRLVRQLMMENVALGGVGVALGIALGDLIIHALPSLIVAPPGFISAIEFKLDDRVLLFTLMISAATVVFFGLAPALRSSRPDLVPALKGDGPVLGRHRWHLRNWLAIAQIAISLTLLACAGVVVQSFSKTRGGDLGFARKQILNVWVAADARPELYRSVVARLQQLPGVRSVAVAVRAPLSLSSNGMAQMVRMPGQSASTPNYEIKYNSVSANFFSTMGTPIFRGRGFDSIDETGSSTSVLINETMAGRFWPNQEAVGKTFTVGVKQPRALQVIGVVKNAPINDIGEAPEPYMYLPYWSNFEQEATFLVETDGNAATLLDSTRKALKSVNAALDPLTMVTMNELIRYSAQRYRLTAALVTALGVIGLLLTIVGVYGVVSHGVNLRTREFGIRMALGADREATLRQVLREVSTLGLLGLLFGFPGALAATRAMQALLFGVSPWSVMAFAAATTVLAVSLLFAGLLPARRATRVEPAHALRTT